MDTESLSAALTPLFPSPHLFTARVVGEASVPPRCTVATGPTRSGCFWSGPSAGSALATGRGNPGAWVPSVRRAAPTSAARRLPTKNCPHPIGPRKFYSGWSCARGEKSLGQGHELFQGATGGVRLPLKTGAAGSASCSSCPPTTTGGRDRRLPPSVSSSQHPRPAVTEQPVGPAYRGDGTTGAGTGGGGGTGRTFCGPDPSGASIHAPFTRITISPIGASP